MDKGAHFRRCDFQVHSPRDQRWSGPVPAEDGERLAYAERLVAACRTKGIGAIAITDHHDMAFIPYVRRAAERETHPNGVPYPPHRRLIVFPGMELTLGVPCQALVIFDAGFPEDMFSLAMTALTIMPADPAQPKAADTQRLTHISSLTLLKQKLDEHSYLRGKYIILPHVGNSGDFSLLRHGFADKYAEMPCVGGYVDGSLDKLNAGNRNIIAGQDRQWGAKRIACFQTSDSRRDDHGQLGEPSTWVKWAEPTAEGLRQACLAQESRIALGEPPVPDSYIASISVGNSSFLGPADLALNPQYSAFIGGRGTGKSTLLEYLRWALCDQPTSTEAPDLPNYQIKRAKLIEGTLAALGAAVEVHYVLNGVDHHVRREAKTGAVELRIGASEWRVCSEDEIRSLLPIQAYSQKQLSDVSVRIDELDRFITAPIQVELNRLEREAADRANRLREDAAAVQRFRDLGTLIAGQALEQQSLGEQAEAIRGSLGGLSEPDRLLIAQGADYAAANQLVAGWTAGAGAIRQSSAQLETQVAAQLAQLAPAPGAPAEHHALLAQLREGYARFLRESQAALAELTGRCDAITGFGVPEGGLAAGWRRAYEAFQGRYSEATTRSSAHRERLGQLSQIEAQLERLSQSLASGREQLVGLQQASERYRAERIAWLATLQARDDLVQLECDRLSERSQGVIRVSLRRSADAGAFLAMLRQVLQGSRMQGHKLEALAEGIVGQADPQAVWLAVVDELGQLALHDGTVQEPSERPASLHLKMLGLTDNDLVRIADALRPEDWRTLSLTPLRSLPVYEYRTGEGRYLPFENASAGQQATALLKTLLNTAGPPLIVDQPEEDLDNPVILEIVRQLWTAKGLRQIIFASHNANLVVNGDAELVAWFGYRAEGDQSRGTIMGQGAIDVTDVRDAIKQIMEGGEDAFRLRHEKYGF